MAGIGNGRKIVLDIEQNVRSSFARHPVAATDIPEGIFLTEEHVNLVKTGNGIPSKYWDLLFGSKTHRSITKGKVLEWKDFGLNEK